MPSPLQKSQISLELKPAQEKEFKTGFPGQTGFLGTNPEQKAERKGG